MTSVLERSALLKSQAYVGGRWIGADSGATFPVYDPATREKIRLAHAKEPALLTGTWMSEDMLAFLRQSLAALPVH